MATKNAPAILLTITASNHATHEYLTERNAVILLHTHITARDTANWYHTV